jgi:dihydroneopterin aldolase/2-amino-4-hydroxy-6-hydroxymethyldihydropteridine diphosphokinase
VDTIEVRGIRVFGRHGANPGEKDVPQPFDVDVWLEVDLGDARRSDALADTVNYDALHRAIVGIVRERSYDLLERLGQDVLDTIMADVRVAHATVRIAKPHLLSGATPVVTLHAQRT